MTKKIAALVLAVLLTLSMVAIPVMAASISTTVKTTNKGDTLNLRKGPHKGNTPVVGYVKNGTKITLMTTDDEDDPEAWNKVKVTSTGAVGYLKNKYITYFGLSNRNGEIDRHEDDDWDYSDADDNDGKRGSGSGSSGSGSGSSSTDLQYGAVSCKPGGSVNVRSGAGTGYRVVGAGRNGNNMRITGKSGNWYKVTFIDRQLSGYIHSDYVASGIAAEINGNGVNMRKGAGSGYASIRKLSRGTEVRMLSKSGSWTRVKYGSSYGWVFSQYVSTL